MSFNYDLELLKEKAQAALLSIKRTAQYYKDSAYSKGQQAEEEEDEKKQEYIFEQMQKNINTALRLEEEFDALNNYIDYLEEFLNDGHEADIYNEGFLKGQESILNFNKREEAARASAWNNERFGTSTEGQWINGVHKSISNIYQ